MNSPATAAPLPPGTASPPPTRWHQALRLVHLVALTLCAGCNTLYLFERIVLGLRAAGLIQCGLLLLALVGVCNELASAPAPLAEVAAPKRYRVIAWTVIFLVAFGLTVLPH